VKNIVINAILRAKEGKEEALFQVMKSIVPLSRAEQGCIQYTLHVHDTDPRTFVFYEIWEHEEALEAHIQSEHYLKYRKQIEGIVEKRDVFKLRVWKA